MSSRTYDSAFANPPSSLFSRFSSMLSALCPLRMTSRLSSLLWTKATVLPLNYSAFDRPRIPKFGISLLSLLSSVILLLFFASCGGKGSSTPSNVGGGYTLQVSGGTLNDGSGYNGLVVLATLRDNNGVGPGAVEGWIVTITGPGISTPLSVPYDDGSSSSYIAWHWKGYDPRSGVYTARATNGSTTLSYNFSIDSASTLPRPVLNKNVNTISWSAISGAGSYFYRVTNSDGSLVDLGYLDPIQTSFLLNDSLPNGSYLVEVVAHTKNRKELMADPTPSPSLPSQENIGLSALDFVIGGTGSGYTMNVRGGVLYQDSDALGTPGYGLVIWTSLLTTTTPQSTPAGDWTITVTSPAISFPVTYTYPRNSSHYAYWEFSVVPVSGQSYTVRAVSSAGTILSQTFTVPNAVAQLPVTTGLTVVPVNGGGANLSWNAVSGAASYYVNIWACVGGTNTPTECIGGVYTEVLGGWFSGTTAVIPSGKLTKGVVYDAYVTASSLDMTTSKTMPPPTPGAQVDMSDTRFTYNTFTAL